MEKINLFLDDNNNWITNIDLLKQLEELGAADCNILYVHSALTFGVPNPNLSRNELLGAIYDVFRNLQVATLCMPTFTFSFCNNRTYDPFSSRSKMGVLNEFFRKQENVIRSDDPLMSVALLGEDKDLITGIGHASVGKDSTFDKMRHRNHVKFLFLGTRIGDCFTYMHYLEWLYKVGYRYDRIFRGELISGETKSMEAYSLFVRYREVIPNLGAYRYEQMMYEQGVARKVTCGNSTISIVEEKVAAKVYKDCLDIDPYYFVTLKDNHLVKDETFILEKEMVAL